MTFVNSFGGVALSRIETAGIYNAADLEEYYYYLNDIRVGDIGNNGAIDTDYSVQIGRRNFNQTNQFRYNSAQSFADFDQSYDPINGISRGTQSTASSYTVHSGDTLQSIALNLWGDAAMWYIIADANGLDGGEELQAGVVLTIPSKTVNVHNNSDTFRVYDPNRVLGQVSPTIPHPKGDGKDCGFAQIFLAIIAIAVAFVVGPQMIAAVANVLAPAGATFTAAGVGFGTITGVGAGGAAVTLGGAATVASFVAGGAIAGAAGSIVSQGVGVATGLQDEFSWNAVGMAALGGAIGGLANVGAAHIPGMGSVMKAVGGADHFAGRMISGAIGNAMTQGIEVATGLQDEFSWAGVAAAGLMAGVGGWAGDKLGLTNAPTVANAFKAGVSGMAGALAGAAAESLIDGSDFGDNFASLLPSAIGQTVGRLFEAGIAHTGGSQDEIVVSAGEPSGEVDSSGDLKRPSPFTSDQLKFARENNPAELKKDLEDLQSDIDRYKAHGNSEKLAKAQERYSELNSLYVQAENVHNAIVDWTAGQVVQVNGEDYLIKGRDFVFESARAAAVDGIASGFLAQRLIGDNWERGGAIYKVEGGYEYTFQVGRQVHRSDPDYVPGGSDLASVRIVPKPYTEAIWHLHPPSSSTRSSSPTDGLAKGNADFSIRDIKLFNDHPEIQSSYLGGSDGSFEELGRVTIDNKLKILHTDTGPGFFGDRRR